MTDTHLYDHPGNGESYAAAHRLRFTEDCACCGRKRSNWGRLRVGQASIIVCLRCAAAHDWTAVMAD